MESVHDTSKGFLTYYDRKDIDSHHCLIEIIELYSNHITVHINASNERLLEEYTKNTNLTIFLLHASPSPRLQPPWMPLFMLNLPPQKPLESVTGAFSTIETPQLRQSRTPPWPFP